jgi:peptidoglycan/LPS O-acetylase OafA/YrhL
MMKHTMFPPRLDALTGIRFLAAIMVVLYHYWANFIPQVPPPRLVANGFMGVSLFYVLSGFILGIVYARGENPQVDKQRFYVARFARIYPAYLLSFVIEFPFVVWSISRSSDHVKKLGIAVGTLMAHLLLVHAWWTKLDWRWNPPSWSISVEALFYLLFPFIVVIVGGRVRRTGPLALMIVACFFITMLAPLALVSQGIGVNAEPRPPVFNFVTIAPIFRIPEFLMGFILSQIYKNLESQWDQRKLQLAGRLSTYAGVAVLVTVILLGGRIPFILRHDGVADLGFAAVIFGLATSHGLAARILSIPIVVLLGEASYGVYIFQAPILEFFSPLILKCSGANLSFQVASLSFYCLVLISFSLFSFKYIESPIRIWILTRYVSPAPANLSRKKVEVAELRAAD